MEMIKNGHKSRVWFNGRTWASQARSEGSIPFTRSIFVEISAFTDKLSKTAVYLKLA